MWGGWATCRANLREKSFHGSLDEVPLAHGHGVGLALGLVLSGLWPHTPLHAVSTDRGETYAIATGPVDNEVEAVYFLDFLTGDLGALVLGRQPRTWTGFFRTNVSTDLGVDPQKNPKFLMVTGMANLRRAGFCGEPEQRHVLRGRGQQRQGGGLRHSLVAAELCGQPGAERGLGAGRRHANSAKRARPRSRSRLRARGGKKSNRPLP